MNNQEKNAIVKYLEKTENDKEKVVEIEGNYNGKDVEKAALPLHLRPIPPIPKPKQVDEDDYIDGISNIIQRDFFPDLERLRKEANDAGIFIQQAHGTTRIISNTEKDDGNKISNLSLDQFQTKYTSEDNSSFNALLDLEAEKRRKKLAHFYPTDQQQQDVTCRLAIEGISKPVNTWKHVSRSAVMYGPEGVPMTLSDYIHTTANPKQIVHAATHALPPPPSINHQIFESRNEALPVGTAPVSTVGTGANSVPVGGNGNLPLQSQEVHIINGYSIIPDTPDIRPEDVDLVTWGVIQSTPLLVDAPSDPISRPNDTKSGFRIPDTPKREILAKRMGEVASNNIKKRTPIPGSVRGGWTDKSVRVTAGGRTPLNSGNTGGVFKKPASPAVALLRSKLQKKNTSTTGGFGSALKGTYSGASVTGTTPGRNWTGNRSSGVTPAPGETDSLLKGNATPGKVIDPKRVTDGLLKDFIL